MKSLAPVALLLFALSARGQVTAGSGHPDFSGVWNSATATPIERPASLANKPFFTKEEAAAFERDSAARNAETPTGTPSRNVGTYNAGFREFGAHVTKTLQTSIVVDPPDGRIPALTPPAAETKARRIAAMRNPTSAPDLGLQDRCLAFVTAIPPMMPYSYNSNYQFIQTADTLVIEVEMLHETRIISLDGRTHGTTRSWLGDSVGRWEGNTLVVDTKNFNDADGFYGDAGGNYGWDRNLHVVERFSLMDANTVLYEFAVDDPTAYTKPWKGSYTMARTSEAIFEYACHEGNYALPNLMKAFATEWH